MQFDDEIGPNWSAPPPSVSVTSPHHPTTPPAPVSDDLSTAQFPQTAPSPFGAVLAPHGPDFRPTYEPATPDDPTGLSPVHAIIGTHFDAYG